MTLGRGRTKVLGVTGCLTPWKWCNTGLPLRGTLRLTRTESGTNGMGTIGREGREGGGGGREGERGGRELEEWWEYDMRVRMGWKMRVWLQGRHDFDTQSLFVFAGRLLLGADVCQFRVSVATM
jgi:hypothetical protein